MEGADLGTPTFLLFVNEASYYEKDTAFVLATKTEVPVVAEQV